MPRPMYQSDDDSESKDKATSSNGVATAPSDATKSSSPSTQQHSTSNAREEEYPEQFTFHRQPIQPSTQSQRQSEIDAQYLERMEEEYAKREGGA